VHFDHRRHSPRTNGWKWPLFMVSYLFVLAYIAAGLTYWTAVAADL
jgi:ferrous iron transport protein B